MYWKWKSKKQYEHPTSWLKGRYGYIALTQSNIYVFVNGNSILTCPFDWAAEKRFQEDERISSRLKAFFKKEKRRQHDIY